MLMDEEFTENLRNASSVEEFLRIIDQADEEKASIDERLEQTSILDEHLRMMLSQLRRFWQ